MTAPAQDTAPIIGPPAPLVLDGIAFVDIGADHEAAWDGETQIGMLGIEDADNSWRARLGDEPWRRMRSRAEARAYIVCAHRDRAGILYPWFRSVAA